MTTPFPSPDAPARLDVAAPGIRCQHHSSSGRRCPDEADYRIHERPAQGPERERVLCEQHTRVSSS